MKQAKPPNDKKPFPKKSAESKSTENKSTVKKSSRSRSEDSGWTTQPAPEKSVTAKKDPKKNSRKDGVNDQAKTGKSPVKKPTAGENSVRTSAAYQKQMGDKKRPTSNRQNLEFEPAKSKKPTAQKNTDINKSVHGDDYDDDDISSSASVSGEKLQKVLARAGLGSRREMEKAIESGEVKVNDRVAQLGDRVSNKDKIFLRGHRVQLAKEATRRRVILYNKPEGEICSRNDPEGRRTVYENLPPLKGERWISIGRLDFNTSGLLLFTNDGELANKLMHPSSVIDREYLVRIQGDVDDEMKRNLLEGVMLDDGVARFTDIVDGAGESRNRWFYCVVMEGRNREVRRLWESQGVKVSRLKRVRYANIFIPSHVRVGQWVELTEMEISDLCKTAGFENNKHTKIFQPTREEKIQRSRHENKLRSNTKSPRIPKPAPRRGE